MTSFEEIGALLGFLAFVGLAVLVFLTFQQGRHLRRLRDWAGRSPERAAALAAREQDPAEPELGEDEPSEEELDAVREPGRFDDQRERLQERWAEIDRRLPVAPRLLIGGIVAVLLGVGIATSGYGLIGGEEGAGNGSRSERAGKGGNGGKDNDRAEGNQGEKSGRVEVAVLNGTAPPGGTGVSGTADRAGEFVKDAGFTVGAVDNAGSFTTSIVMWTGSGQEDAEKLAAELGATVFGPVTVATMSAEVEALAGGAEVALVVGQDDQAI
jgi:hypothetical protein